MFEDLFTLFMLILLQAVLGLDNLLYISIESKRAPLEQQKKVRMLGIGIAVVARIVLLFVLLNLIQYFTDPLLILDWGIVDGNFNLHSLLVLFGGLFIMYTAVKEIWHMVYLEEQEEHHDRSNASVAKVITMIVVMNLVFSFDSILSTLALTDKFWIMITAIGSTGVLMIWLANKVAEFLQRNRMFEVLGLFVLLLVGVMLLSEAGHMAHLHFFGYEVVAMNKTTFYFVIVTLIIVDAVQGRYQRKLIKSKKVANAINPAA